jgi:prepilin-type N-terminal cleavage/methylation domain-containing protein
LKFVKPAPYFRQSGFTLVEMLAAMIGGFLVVGAATGFLLTAMQRQASVLQATALEAQHEALAEIMDDSIKSAVDFQIYQDAPPNPSSTPLPAGNSSGDYLVCVDQEGASEFHFDGVQIEYQQIPQKGAAQKRFFPGASRVSAQNGKQMEPIFNSNLGIVQAHWNVETTVDQVPFDVFGVPLQMQ